MNMPGFTAEASLANPKEPYRVVRRFSDRNGRASVIPALPQGQCARLFLTCEGGNYVACYLLDRYC